MTDDDLIDGYLHDQLSPEEVAQLEERLRTDRSMRERYRRYAEMVYGIETLARTGHEVSQATAGQSAPRKSMRFWAPWTQIAAACVITAILASTASAWYAGLRYAMRVEVVPLLRDSFESPATVIRKRFPVPEGGWRGDGSLTSVKEADVAAPDGNGVFRLEPHERRKLSYLDGLVDLREAQEARAAKGAKRLRVSCRVALRPEKMVDQEWVHYRLRVATFTTPPEHTLEEWRQGPPQLYGATYSHRAVRVNTGRDQWHLLETEVEVPEDAQSMMLSVSASANGEYRGNHLVDFVEAELVFEYEFQ